VVFYGMMLMLWSVFAAAFFFYDRARSAELERARFETIAREAELSVLRLQVNPHFLFNSFATLRALVGTEPALARDAITRLSTMMRYALQSSRQPTVPLADELQMVESYLYIEALRLGERLRVSATVTGEVSTCPVPPLSLQTLVENAVKFGAANRREGGSISYLVVRHGGNLCMTVSNPGRIDSPSDSTGLGLKNLRARLEHLYGLSAQLRLVQLGENEVVAELDVPDKLAQA
jgi:LytS/YehU family sensor histidine kinase